MQILKDHESALASATWNPGSPHIVRNAAVEFALNAVATQTMSWTKERIVPSATRTVRALRAPGRNSTARASASRSYCSSIMMCSAPCSSLIRPLYGNDQMPLGVLDEYHGRFAASEIGAPPRLAPRFRSGPRADRLVRSDIEHPVGAATEVLRESRLGRLRIRQPNAQVFSVPFVSSRSRSSGSTSHEPRNFECRGARPPRDRTSMQKATTDT